MGRKCKRAADNAPEKLGYKKNNNKKVTYSVYDDNIF